MRSFFKIFFASLLAFFVFSLLVFLLISGWIGGLLSNPKAETGSRAVLYIDLNQTYHEKIRENPLSSITEEEYDQPGVYDLVRLIHHAESDTAVKGIFLKCNGNPNGFSTSEEIRNSLVQFKKSGKFLFAYADGYSQKSYYVASVADSIYCNPKGGVDWIGFSSRLPFLKGMLQKLDIEAQIFYAGKFKSATEPLREDKMTDANRLQTTELLNGLYNHFLLKISEARRLDSAILRKCVNEHLIRFARDAKSYNLVDGLKYDDEVKDIVRTRLSIGKNDKINFVSAAKYANATNYKKYGKDKIALIYAEGDIVAGKSDQDQIGDETYRGLIRRARMDNEIKAIVIRINSGGGSSLASENLWREITVARKSKPVVVSFGDVAASGAYYLSCNADSIFSDPGSITGSIGVFGLLPNLQAFFKNKLGISFDGVRTAPDADWLTITKPLNENQKRFFQSEIDSIYADFKSRVSQGRDKSMDYVESIAQGRVWTGEKGFELGLVDKLGGIQDAIDCAARMAKTTDYRLREFPEPKSFLDKILGSFKKNVSQKAVQDELGSEGQSIYKSLRHLKEISEGVQARMPFDLEID
ncbi:MAG: signal peptide peptidase SppA [Chitinophagales bacterium]